MEKTIAEQIQALGMGVWQTGAYLSNSGKSLAVYLPKDFAPRFENGCFIKTMRTAENELLVRVTPDSAGSRSHLTKTMRRGAAPMIELTRARGLLRAGLPLFGRTPCEYTATPTQILLRLPLAAMHSYTPRSRVINRASPAPHLVENRGGHGRAEVQGVPSDGVPSDNLTPIEQAIEQVTEAWNKTVGVSDVALLRAAVRTINAARDASGGALTLQLADDGRLIALMTTTVTID